MPITEIQYLSRSCYICFRSPSFVFFPVGEVFWHIPLILYLFYPNPLSNSSPPNHKAWPRSSAPPSGPLSWRSLASQNVERMLPGAQGPTPTAWKGRSDLQHNFHGLSEHFPLRSSKSAHKLTLARGRGPKLAPSTPENHSPIFHSRALFSFSCCTGLLLVCLLLSPPSSSPSFSFSGFEESGLLHTRERDPFNLLYLQAL